MTESIVRIIGGLLGIFLGRRLFWLFAAVTGFLVGYQLVYQLPFAAAWADWLRILAAVGLGLVLAVLAASLIRLAGMLVGFAVGWQLATWLLPQFGLITGQAYTIWQVAIGAVCALLVLIFLDWGIIVLSSIYGATNLLLGLSQVVGFATLGSTLYWIILVALVLVGILAQGAQLRGMRS